MLRRSLRGSSRATTVAAVAAASLTLIPGAAHAERGGVRTETHDYAHGSGVRTSHWDYAGDDLDLPGLVFHPRPEDRYVKFDYADATGSVGFLFFRQAGRDGLRGDYCGIDGVFRLHSHKPIEVRVLTGLCDNHLIAVATRGTVTATFADHALGALARKRHRH